MKEKGTGDRGNREGERIKDSPEPGLYYENDTPVYSWNISPQIGLYNIFFQNSLANRMFTMILEGSEKTQKFKKRLLIVYPLSKPGRYF